MGPFVCAPDLGCVDGVCAALPGDGEPCTLDSRCAGDLACDFTPRGSVCGPRKPAFAPCQNDQICEEGLYCEFSLGQCTAILAAGSPCNDGNECGPTGSCLPGPSGAFECAPKPSAGQRCLFECTEGLHCAPLASESFCAPEICLDL
ncbi:MAG: Dickkopf N-terminal cysteine-rich domain-containing protein [Polyangiaceae bacterium]